MGVPFPPHISGGVRCHPIVALICISLTSDVEHLFLCLLAVCVSSFVKCLFISFDWFYYWAVCLLEFYVFFLNSWCFLKKILKSFIRWVFCKYFPSGCCLAFHHLSKDQSLDHFDEVQFIFLPCLRVKCHIYKNLCLTWGLEDFFLYFPLTVLCFSS